MTVLGSHESDDKDTMYTEQSEVPAHNRIMRQMAPSGELKNDGGDEIRRHDGPGRALEDFPDEIDEAEGVEPMAEEDDLRPDQREFITRELALFKELRRIIMRDDKPLKQRYYPRNPAMQSVIDTQVDELLSEDAIEPSRSPHSAPIVLVKKKTGEWRMCVDYRQLNAHSVPDAYPFPRINHILEKLRQARYISTLDLKHGYWQIPMDKDSLQFTAFTVPGRGLYQWKVMTFGLHSARATFQRALDGVIGADMEPFAFAYLDDIIVIGATEEQHLSNLAEKGRKWSWGPEQQSALEEVKRRLTTAPVLGCPDFDKTFVLQTDASDVGLGEVLSQDIEGQERVIAPSGRVAGRWALELQQFQFDVRYRRVNVVADALSRQPCEVLQQMAEVETHCKWIQGMQVKIREYPEKFSDYMMKNGQLYRNLGHRADDEDYFPWKLCVPSSNRVRVLRECHDAPTAGHLGVRKTISRLSQRYFWPGMFRDAKRYVQRCESCQKFKTAQTKAAGKMLTRVTSEPFDVLCADFVGPLPRSKHGNTMLLVFHDIFSKWVELIPIPKATAAQVQKAFRERILGRVGIPRKFVCDNGTQFTSRTLKEYFSTIGVEVQYTAPYCPQENPTLLDQVLTKIQGTGWDGSFMKELTSSIATPIKPRDELAPLPEGWIGTGELRRLPASAIRLIAERAPDKAGRGHSVRFAVKGMDWHYLVTVKSDGGSSSAPGRKGVGVTIPPDG
ncbi:uncharacterized protein K02A2.6-like [Drosophila rhopaloa]|uniref:RNA-directed DNA polymerase n=1 Tax=Drosophila rhopaloa TaxID=1041015 RepID=A0ABM5JF45_DRORH|nr:uncharacterized protein K02A2.6-like [Drosophila rhopaloa]